jgi:hypothetical protein
VLATAAAAPVLVPTCVLVHDRDYQQRYRKKPLRKEVRFLLEPSREPKQTAFIESPLLEKELVATLWWSRADIYHMWRQTERALNQVRQEHPDYADGIVRLLKECYKDASTAQCLASTHLEVLLNPRRQDMRGLERRLYKTISQCRSYHAKSMLQIQQRLPKGNTRLLRSWSMHSSRRSRVMARLLAHADSLEVAAMVRQELESEEGLGIEDTI